MTGETGSRLARAAPPPAVRLARSLWGLALLLTVVGVALVAVNGSAEHSNPIGSPRFEALFLLAIFAFPTVGVLIATRHPGNAVGWVFLGLGVAGALQGVLVGYSTYALVRDPGSLPAGAAAAFGGDLLAGSAPAVCIPLLLLLFPDGRPPSPRWRLLVWLVALGTVSYVAGTVLLPGPLYFQAGVDNPLGVEGAGSAARTVLDVTSGVQVATIVAAIVALILRFRRSRGDERRQLAWLAYAGGILLLAMPVLILLGTYEVEVAGARVGDVLFTLLIAAVPVAVGVAILRHRLYDIDLVINRTLVYGALTATLAGAYLGCVLVFQLLLSPLTEDSGLAIAGSTLAVAALSRPARARIQAAVDRRFYRRRYDAARTLEAFTARLRDELDLEALAADLRRAVRETMQPAHVSLWVRSRR
jgi:hypothetical protein